MNAREEAFLGSSEAACNRMQTTVQMRLSVGDAIRESEVGSIPDVFRRVKFGRVRREKL